MQEQNSSILTAKKNSVNASRGMGNPSVVSLKKHPKAQKVDQRVIKPES
jgi:hypothetical protein